jgi:hypothetical protein
MAGSPAPQWTGRLCSGCCEHTPIIDQPLWDAVQAQLNANTTERRSGTRTRQPSLLAGMLFDGDGDHMTPTHATKKGTRYRYYVSRPLITSEQSAALRIPAGEIEQAVTSRLRLWLVDPGSVYQAIRLADPSAQRRLIARDGSVAPPAAGRYRAGAARSLRSLHRQPAPRGLDFPCVQVMTTAGSPARPWIGPLCNGCSPTSRRLAHPR